MLAAIGGVTEFSSKAPSPARPQSRTHAGPSHCRLGAGIGQSHHLTLSAVTAAVPSLHTAARRRGTGDVTGDDARRQNTTWSPATFILPQHRNIGTVVINHSGVGLIDIEKK
jgi:hypothetical protein